MQLRPAHQLVLHYIRFFLCHSYGAKCCKGIELLLNSMQYLQPTLLLLSIHLYASALLREGS